jgi:hypothetical protein
MIGVPKSQNPNEIDPIKLVFKRTWLDFLHTSELLGDASDVVLEVVHWPKRQQQTEERVVDNTWKV